MGNPHAFCTLFSLKWYALDAVSADMRGGFDLSSMGEKRDLVLYVFPDAGYAAWNSILFVSNCVLWFVVAVSA